MVTQTLMARQTITTAHTMPGYNAPQYTLQKQNPTKMHRLK